MIAAIRKIVQEGNWLASTAGPVGDGDDLYALGLTSHASVELMLALEDEFNVEFPERMLKRSTFESITSLSEALQELGV